MLLKIRSYWVIVLAFLAYSCSPDDGGRATDPGLVFIELSGEENFYEDMDEEVPLPSYKRWGYSFTSIERGRQKILSVSSISFTINNVENEDAQYNIQLSLRIGNQYLKKGTYELDHYSDLPHPYSSPDVPFLNVMRVDIQDFGRRLNTGQIAMKKFTSQSGVLVIDRTEEGGLYGDFTAELAYVYTNTIDEFEIEEDALQVKGRFIINNEN